MKKNIEMRLYELLGVKAFRKFVFGIYYVAMIPTSLGKTKEERKKIMYNTASNYNLGKVENLEDLMKFKKMIYFNAFIHTSVLIMLIPNFLRIANGTSSIFNLVFTGLLGPINAYCVMLQRYNLIRINKVIEKGKPRYYQEKMNLKEEVIKKDQLLKEHSYKLIDKKNRIEEKTFEDIISNATIQELKMYREYLEYSECVYNRLHDSILYQNENISVDIPTIDNKQLKLEFESDSAIN